MPRKKEIEEESKEQDKTNLPTKVGRVGNSKVWNQLAKELGINDKQKRFCDIYANDNELRGNGIQAYAKAFNMNLAKPGTYNAAKANASILLQKDNILKYINHIFESTGLNDAAVDGELLFAIRQNTDFGSKVAAIKVYNDLRNRIEKNQQKNQVNFQINIAPSQNNTEVSINQIEDKREEAA
jgi:hypothetical protein